MNKNRIFRIFLFGEAEKGKFCTPLNLKNLLDLSYQLGNPPRDSTGIDYAIQTLLYNRGIIFYRVREEGFSLQDYFHGLKFLDQHGKDLSLAAVAIPGVGDAQIIEPLSLTCQKLRILLVLSQKDLYDYLTGSKY